MSESWSMIPTLRSFARTSLMVAITVWDFLPANPSRVPLRREEQVFTASNLMHTILFTCNFQNTACRLPKFHCTNSSNALLFIFVMKKQCEQILETMWIKLYDLMSFSSECR